MKTADVFPSKYLKAADLGGKHIKLTIAKVQREKLGEDEVKPIMYFTRSKKGLVLNRTNWRAIAVAYGDESDQWTNKEVILFSMMVQFRDELKEAIRVRIEKPVAAPAALAASENPADGFGDDDNEDNIEDTF